MACIPTFLKSTVSALDIDGAALVKIEVEAGPHKPYCLCSKGFVPAGVYRRLGPANVPIEMAQIRSMIKRTDGDYFETARSHEQSLTFLKPSGPLGARRLRLTKPLKRISALSMSWAFTPIWHCWSLTKTPLQSALASSTTMRIPRLSTVRMARARSSGR